jgi:hypothetical protein
MTKAPSSLFLSLWMSVLWIPLLRYVVLLRLLFGVIRLHKYLTTSIEHALRHAKRNY